MSTRTALIAACLTVATGCASISKAKAAEAMACPEADVKSLPAPAPDSEGAKMFAALVAFPVYVGPTTGRLMNRVIASDQIEQRWQGCGLTVACDGEGCAETAESRGARLVRAVPAVMEKSRLRHGEGTTAEQVGYFTWDLTTPRGVTHCRVLNEELFKCHPDLEGAP